MCWNLTNIQKIVHSISVQLTKFIKAQGSQHPDSKQNPASNILLSSCSPQPGRKGDHRWLATSWISLAWFYILFRISYITNHLYLASLTQTNTMFGRFIHIECRLNCSFSLLYILLCEYEVVYLPILMLMDTRVFFNLWLLLELLCAFLYILLLNI